MCLAGINFELGGWCFCLVKLMMGTGEVSSVRDTLLVPVVGLS